MNGTIIQKYLNENIKEIKLTKKNLYKNPLETHIKSRLAYL